MNLARFQLLSKRTMNPTHPAHVVLGGEFSLQVHH